MTKQRKTFEQHQYSAADVLRLVKKWDSGDALTAKCRLDYCLFRRPNVCNIAFPRAFSAWFKNPVNVFTRLLHDLPDDLRNDFRRPSWSSAPESTIEEYAEKLARVYARLDDESRRAFHYVLTDRGIEDQS